MTKLMAPILSFTAEEIWQLLPLSERGIQPRPGGASLASVHLAVFPDPDDRWHDPALAERWEQLLQVRSVVQHKLEEQRREKVIGSSLEAQVRLTAGPDRYRFLAQYKGDLSALFIVSEVVLEQATGSSAGSDLRVEVLKSPAKKCERCWNYLATVGAEPDHPTLCHRCVEAIR
jgi:isoleucyl-tRNA synthetase